MTKAESVPKSTTPIQQWWKSDSALANWLGLRFKAKDYGLTISGSANENFYGLVTGGLPNQPRGTWGTEVKIRASFDFRKLFGLEGLTLESDWRYRNVNGSPNLNYTSGAAGTSGASFMFAPNHQTTGLGMRILPQFLQWQSDDSKDPRFMVNAGWENPYEQFLLQPLSKMFENAAIESSKGIGGQAGPGIPVVNQASSYNYNGTSPTTPKAGSVRYYASSPVPWSSSYASWGGTLRVKPTRTTYVQSGLYLAISGANGVSPTQFTATSVYPYTSVPKSYLGSTRSSGQVVGVVGPNGQIIPGASQNLGWVPGVQNNHGFNFSGAPSFNPNTSNVGVKPVTAKGAGINGIPNGTAAGASTYRNAKGQYVKAPAYYAASPYDQGSGGNYSQNGLYNVNEIGWTPKLGTDKLEGKYAVGSYIWGQNNTSYTSTQYTPSTFNANGSAKYTSYAATKPAPFQQNQVVWGMYFQADQRLFAEREESSVAPSLSKNPVAATPAGPSKTQGLYSFNEFTFTPPQNNALPFYFQTGLVYKGLIPHRDNDSCGVALGAGFYSSYFNQWIQSQNQALQNAYGTAYNATVPNGPVQQGSINPTTGVANTGKSSSSPLTNYYQYAPMFSSTEVVEAFYNFQVNKWAALKPFAQWIVNPAGNGTVANDLVLGASVKVLF
jgi:carbohydrate-selective porin OprB